jgi:hypothetical protein
MLRREAQHLFLLEERIMTTAMRKTLDSILGMGFFGLMVVFSGLCGWWLVSLGWRGGVIAVPALVGWVVLVIIGRSYISIWLTGMKPD